MGYKKLAVSVAAIAAVLMLTAACEPEKAPPDPQSDTKPQATERIITLEGYATEPFSVKWHIEGGKGLSPDGEDHVAGGIWKRPLTVGKTPLFISITVKAPKGVTGWARISDDKREVAYVPIDRTANPAVAIANYHYKP